MTTSLLSTLVATSTSTPSPTAGAVVWWRLNGTATVACVEAHLTHIGVTAPSAPTAEAALRRALTGTVAGGARRLARRMDDRGRRLAVVREATDAGQDDLTYDVEVRATLERNATGAVYLDTRPHTPVVHAAYDAALGTLTSDDVGLWLARHAVVLADGVSLRDTGGVYFIPAHGLPVWRSIVAALKACSAHAFFELPTYADDDSAVEGVLDSLTQAITADLAVIQAKADEGGMGERAIETQRKKIAAATARVTRYEAVLGATAPALHAAIKTLGEHEVFATMVALGGTTDPFAGIDFPSF